MSGPVCHVAQHDLGRLLPPMGRHLRSCLACQAELARRRRLLRELRGLRELDEPAPTGLADAVGRRVQSTDQDVHRGPGGLVMRSAAAAGAVAATAVGAAVVVVRRRGHAPV